MAYHDYIFFLQDKERRFWQLDASGNVVISAAPYALKFSPSGWQETQIDNIRNKKYWAVDRSVSTDYKFVGDGAAILKHIFYTKGSEESVYLVVCERKLDYSAGVNYGYWYKQAYRSEIDLSTFGHDGPYVTCNTLEDGFAKHLKANENTVYEIPLDPGVSVKMDGVTLYNQPEWFVPESQSLGIFFLGMQLLPSESPIPGLAIFSVDQTTTSFSEDDNGDKAEYFAEATQDITGLRLHGTFKKIQEGVVGTTTVTLELQIWNTITNSARLSIDLAPDDPYTPEQDLSVDVTFDVVKGDRLFLKKIFRFSESDLQLDITSRFDTSYVKALRPADVFSELIHRMSDGEFEAETGAYLTTHQDKVFTSGNGIRGLDGATLKISFAQFLSFWNCFDEVGIREKAGQILMARKKALVDSASIIDLGEISKPKIRFDKELPFNELAVGYGDIKNENGFVNGKNEFNTTFNFSLGTTKNPRKYDKVSQVKASCYDIERIRIDSINQDSTDNRSDNDSYVVHIDDTLVAGSGDVPDHYELNRSLNPYLSGVDQKDSIFNADLSPKRCLLRSGDYLRSVLYLSDPKTLKFISADRNDAMEYVNGSDIVNEKDDVSVGSLDDRFFHPVVVSIDVSPPQDILDLLDDNPLSIFQFTLDGNTYRMISLKNGLNPQTDKKQTFEGWLTSDCDASKLVDYYG